MDYRFIEIGTSDFNYLCGRVPGPGISVEPVPYYLRRLPKCGDTMKVNAAISDRNGAGMMFYFHRDDIARTGVLPDLAGCNTLFAPHPVATKFPQCVPRQCPVEIIDVVDFMLRYDVVNCDYLKIDTEGHDCIILKRLLEWSDMPRIRRILFESNSLSSIESVRSVKKLATSRGYSITAKRRDTLLELAQ